MPSEGEPPSPGPAPGKLAWQFAVLVGLVLVAYLPIWRAGFVWDDDNILTDNLLVRASNGLYQFWCTRNASDYWPLTSSTLWIEWRLWGMNPLGYHLTNLAMHLAEILLLWSVLRRLRIPGAWLAAALFAVHPLNVESVAWIAQRKNLLAMLFYLLAILCFLRSGISDGETPARSTASGPQYGARRRFASAWYCLSLFAFISAMLSKGSVAMLPFVLLGIVRWQRPPTRADLLRLAPFFVVAASFAAVDVWFQGHGGSELIRRAGILERLLGAGGIVWFYLCKAFWPVRLIFIYPQWRIRTADVIWWLPLTAALLFTALLWRLAAKESLRPPDKPGRRLQEGNKSRAALFAWGYFCTSLVPVLGFTDVYFMKYSLVANHYAHLAIIGVAAWVGFAVESLHRRTTGPARIGLRAVASIAIVLLAGLTWRQSRTYRDPVTLNRSILAQDPESWMGNNNLGIELAKNPADSAGAIFHYEQALRSKPDYAPAHNNLAIELAKIPGRLPEAITHYEEALRIDPGYALAHQNLANALAKTPGRLPEAVAHYEQALRMRPDDAEVHGSLAVALGKLPGRQPEALAHFERSLQIDPHDPVTHYNLANLLMQSPGRLQDALAQYLQALRINPDFEEAHYNLAVAYARAGNIDNAIAHFERVLELDPANRAARENLETLRVVR